MPDSLLCSVELPCFDPQTRELTLASHHLLSAPLSLANSLPSAYRPILHHAPAEPYQQHSQEVMLTSQSRRKRRKLAVPNESSSPAEFAVHRKKQEQRTTTDRETDEHHSSISLALEEAVGAVREAWTVKEGKGWTGEVDDLVQWRGTDESSGEGLDLVGLAQRHPLPPYPLEALRLSDPLAKIPLDQLFNRIVLNSSTSESTVAELEDLSTNAGEPTTFASLLLPPSSAFLLSDFFSWSSPSSGIASLRRLRGGWDVLIADPPWPNASATRSSSYDTFDAYDLWKLDLPALLGDKPTLVVFWLTNRVKFRRLLIDKLFPSWNVKNAVEWYWVKIAEDGEPVVPLEAKHRRCYESLVLGYYVPLKTKVDLPSLPQNKVFLSTPIGHSRKPVIIDLLRPYLLDPSRPPNVLELFARTTLAGVSLDPSSSSSPGSGSVQQEKRRGLYFAVGNEAVRFNVLDETEKRRRGWLRGGEIKKG
ncbi:hypothetical protein JCM8547_004895 [Rhodosporidiobolus lusitaniae]